MPSLRPSVCRSPVRREQFNEPAEIAGVVVSVRKQVAKICLWTRTEQNQAVQTQIAIQFKKARAWGPGALSGSGRRVSSRVAASLHDVPRDAIHGMPRLEAILQRGVHRLVPLRCWT